MLGLERPFHGGALTRDKGAGHSPGHSMGSLPPNLCLRVAHLGLSLQPLAAIPRIPLQGGARA